MNYKNQNYSANEKKQGLLEVQEESLLKSARNQLQKSASGIKISQMSTEKNVDETSHLVAPGKELQIQT